MHSVKATRAVASRSSMGTRSPSLAPAARSSARRPGHASNQVQAKLRVGAQCDPLEREADAAAARVTAGQAAPSLTAADGAAQRKAADAGTRGATGPAIGNVFQRGAPLPGGLRSDFESGFGERFGDVRVHTDPAAGAFAASLGARAVTQGRDVAFAPGEYAPGAPAGRALIAHELAHVVQQRGGTSSAPDLQRDLKDDATHRSILPSELDAVSTEQLRTVHAFLEALWEQNKATSWQGEDAVPANLAVIRAALLKRSAAPGSDAGSPQVKAKPPLIPGMRAASDAGQLNAAARVIDGLHQIGSDLNVIEVQGRIFHLTDARAAEIRLKVRTAMATAIGRSTRGADSALSGYNIQSETDKKHWIVSRIVKTFGGVSDPLPHLQALAGTSYFQAGVAAAALKEGNFVLAAEALSKAEMSGKQADMMFQAYWQDIIAAGEMTVTVLEATRDVSFAILAIAATVATAGAAAGVTSIGGFGLGAAGTANLIALAAPMAAQFGEAGVKLAYGDKVNWGELAIDTAISIIMYKFGGKLAGKIGLRLLASNAGARSLGRQALANIVSGVIVGRGAALVQIAIKDVYAALKGKTVTSEIVQDQVVTMLFSKQQLFMDILIGSIGGYGAAKGAARPGAAPVDAGHAPELPAAANTTASSGNASPTTHQQPQKPQAPTQTTPAVAHEPVPQAGTAGNSEPMPQAQPVQHDATPAVAHGETSPQPEVAAPSTSPSKPITPKSNAELTTDVRTSIEQLRAARASAEPGTLAKELNATERSIKALRERLKAAPDPALQKTMEALSIEYTNLVDSKANLQGAGPTTVSGQTSAAQSAKDAATSKLVDLDKGRIGVQTHGTAPGVRLALGTSGATHQSAHLVPQAVDRAIGASAGTALTVNLPTATHRQIDGDWIPKWNRAVAEGRQITGGDVLAWVGEGIQKTPPSMLTQPARNTLEWRLSVELQELGVTIATILVPARP